LAHINIGNILNGFKGKRVLVVGDLILDRYLEGRVERISPEAPVPVVSLENGRGRLVPGGAANVARNVFSLGGIPVVAGVGGDDAEGGMLKDLLRDEGIDTTALVTDSDRPTTTKTRVMSGGHQLIRLDREVTSPVSERVRKDILAGMATVMDSIDVVILEDYNKGVLVPELIAETITLAREKDVPVIVDPKFTNFFAYRGCSLFKPNRLETSRALGMDIQTPEDAAVAGESLLDRLNASAVLITLGSRGSLLCRKGMEPFHVKAATIHVYDVSGAGDTVAAVMALAMAAGVPLEEGVRIAVLAAAATCGEPGVYAVRPEDVVREEERHSESSDLVRG